MEFEKSFDAVLKAACPSIQYRIKGEINGEVPSTDGMQVLQTLIVRDDAVKRIIASQAPDGWFGRHFHGYDSLEAGIRLLCEKGLSPQHPVLARALASLENNTDRASQDLGRVGKVLDEGGFGGTGMMQAVVLAYAGVEQPPLVQEQIQAALQGFQAVLNVSAIEEIMETYRGKSVFKTGVKWPGIYHLRLLAFTHGWRNQANQAMLRESIDRLVRLSPIPYIYVRYKSQLIAPASFAMQEFDADIRSMGAAQWMLWFHRMEMLARLGVVCEIPELARQAGALKEMLHQGGGWFTRPLRHAYFTKWGAYTGLMLERDWKSTQRRIFDLTFRSLFILHYSGI